MIIATYILAIFVGFTIGLFGGGGSILTVPILVYIAGINPLLATSYSIVIVGITALIGAITKVRRKEVHIIKAINFGISSLITLYIVRRYVIDLIPEMMFKIGEYQFTKHLFILLLFSILMILASYSMIAKKYYKLNNNNEISNVKVILLGIIIGLFIGIVGAGGGFLFVPALVNFAKMKFKEAIGTSMLIVSMNSIFGFIGDVLNEVNYDVVFLTIFSLISIVGVLIGSKLSKKIESDKLKKSFGLVILLIAVIMIIKETLF